MRTLFCLLVLCAFVRSLPAQETTSETTVLNRIVKTIDGADQDLSQYLGDVLMIVNVASKCGLTPQYAQLQAVHEKYADQGFRVLGFPCNQFGGQEPGTAADIKQFCSSQFNVSFPMFAKIDVNGDSAADLYKTLTSTETKPAGKGDISWNFEKFIVNRGGQVVARYAPRTKPDDPQVIQTIETELARGQ